MQVLAAMNPFAAPAAETSSQNTTPVNPFRSVLNPPVIQPPVLQHASLGQNPTFGQQHYGQQQTTYGQQQYAQQQNGFQMGQQTMPTMEQQPVSAVGQPAYGQQVVQQQPQTMQLGQQQPTFSQQPFGQQSGFLAPQSPFLGAQKGKDNSSFVPVYIPPQHQQLMTKTTAPSGPSSKTTATSGDQSNYNDQQQAVGQYVSGGATGSQILVDYSTTQLDKHNSKQIQMSQQNSQTSQQNKQTDQDSQQMMAVLSERIRNLETQVAALSEENAEKDREIEYLRRQKTPVREFAHRSTDSSRHNASVSTSQVRSTFSTSRPAKPYQTVDCRDPVDMRLAEFYNTTSSIIPFQRINRGFYKFGRTVVEVDIINHKLMARTDDGWNRRKYAPIEKFLCAYEMLERDRCGISQEHCRT